MFFVADEDDVDDADAADEEEEQAWPVLPSEPAPASEPPALVLPDIDIIERLDPLLNPTIAKAVPADTIRGAGIGGALLTLLWSFLFSSPFSVLSPGTLAFAASVGLIAAYVSITEGAAGEFARSVGTIAIQLTDAVAGIVEGWQAEKEVGRIADALLTPPPPPEAARAAAKARAEEEAAEKALRARMRAEEEARAAEEARLLAEEDARWRAEEEALARATSAAKEERARRLAEEEASRARAEEEARLRAEVEARELVAAEEARRLEEQVAAAREAVRLMEEQEALMEDEDEDERDGYDIDNEDWEASVRLAEELRGMEGGRADDELLRMEMDDLSAEEEDALGRAAREAVLKYEAEMAAKLATPVAEAPINGIEEEDDYEEEAEEVDYSKMTVVQLKDVLRSKGLKVSGKKAVLIERLVESS